MIPDTPAEAAGLQAEDIIVEVDGTSTKGMTTTDVVALIKGKENTDVTLTVYRKGETDYLDITVTRKRWKHRLSAIRCWIAILRIFRSHNLRM